MSIGVKVGDLGDGRMRQVVVVVVADDDCIDDGDIADIAGCLGVSLGSPPGQRRTTVLEDGVEKHSEAGWKLNVVASVAKPSCPELVTSLASWEKGWLVNRDSRGRGVGIVAYAAKPASPEGSQKLDHVQRGE